MRLLAGSVDGLGEAQSKPEAAGTSRGPRGGHCALYLVGAFFQNLNRPSRLTSTALPKNLVKVTVCGHCVRDYHDLDDCHLFGILLDVLSCLAVRKDRQMGQVKTTGAKKTHDAHKCRHLPNFMKGKSIKKARSSITRKQKQQHGESGRKTPNRERERRERL